MGAKFITEKYITEIELNCSEDGKKKTSHQLIHSYHLIMTMW